MIPTPRYRMTNTMTKTLLALLALAVMTGEASAQSRTFYNARGNVVGRASTDNSGTITNYDARGRVITRETTSGNTTTIYDSGGRNVGRVTSPQR
jgi:YD repeat-containing protein